MATIGQQRYDRTIELSKMEDKELLDLATDLVVANKFISSVYDFYSTRGYITNKQKMAVVSTIVNEELPLRNY